VSSCSTRLQFSNPLSDHPIPSDQRPARQEIASHVVARQMELTGLSKEEAIDFPAPYLISSSEPTDPTRSSASPSERRRRIRDDVRQKQSPMSNVSTYGCAYFYGHWCFYRL